MYCLRVGWFKDVIENFDLKMHKSKKMMLQIWMIETEKEINEEGYGELERTKERTKESKNEGRPLLLKGGMGRNKCYNREMKKKEMNE